MSLIVPMLTRAAIGRNDLINNYGATSFVQPPINDLNGLMNRPTMSSMMGGGMMGGGIPGMGMGGSMMGSGMGMGMPGINSSSVGGFVTGAAVGAVAMNVMQNGGLNGANSIDHPQQNNMQNGGYNNGQPQNNYPNNNYNNGQPQNNYPNNNYNNGQPQNNYPNNGYNNGQPQNNYPNNGYNSTQPQNNFPNNNYNSTQPQNNFPNNNYNSTQPQNNFPNNGYNSGQPQNNFPNNGYNSTQPQNNYPNNNYNSGQPQRNGDPLNDLFAPPPQPVRNTPQNNGQQGQNNWEPVRNTPTAGQGTNYGVQQPVNNAPAAYASSPQQVQPTVRRNRVEPTGDRLSKGQKYSIKDRDGNPVNELKICLGWDIKDGRCELDASAFMLAENGKVPGDEWFIFYGQPDSPDNGVHYKVFKDDPRSPDDAAIELDLTRVDQRVQKIEFAVTIYEASRNALHFGMVQNLYARIVDRRTNREIASFTLDECYSTVTAMVLGELYRYKGEWKFNAVGSGVNKDLAEFCGIYGVALE
ncbi:TerD family protein [uncultured Ruminococcus sp.]|uniref:TerD family protein n=1 Tax=uncultured Ruminococcus sp. TaxID=165186 RepID=UPI0025E19EAE|nr:TerD family protein [uncultured Ruminococcus sp.]